MQALFCVVFLVMYYVMQCMPCTDNANVMTRLIIQFLLTFCKRTLDYHKLIATTFDIKNFMTFYHPNFSWKLLFPENLMRCFVTGESFKAHRLVLAACSAHFSKLFSNSTLNGQLIVILEGTHHQDLQILLQFMYKGVAYLHQDRIESVLRTAEVLQVSRGPVTGNLNSLTLPRIS